MDPLVVPGQAAFPGERFAAQLARIPFGGAGGGGGRRGMASHVLLVAAPVGERPAAPVAQERLLAGVGALVPVQSVLPAEPASAVAALEALHGVVEAGVDRQVAGALERLATDVTLMWPAIGVPAHVFRQAAPVRKRLAADRAAETVRLASASLRPRPSDTDPGPIGHRFGFRFGTNRSRVIAAGPRHLGCVVAETLQHPKLRQIDAITCRRGTPVPFGGVDPGVFLHVSAVHKCPPAVEAGIRAFAGVQPKMSHEVAFRRQNLAAVRALVVSDLGTRRMCFPSGKAVTWLVTGCRSPRSTASVGNC